MGIGDWGLGIGDWGLGIGPNPQSPKKVNLVVVVTKQNVLKNIVNVSQIIDFAQIVYV